MVGSSFILINKNGRRKLLNISRITALHNEDILLTAVTREVYWEFPPEQEMVYTIQIDLGGRQNFQYMFDKAEERDDLLNQLITAISPSAIIDSAPGLPATWADIARSGRPESKPKPVYDENGYTKEELDMAMTIALAQIKSARESAPQRPAPIPEPPTPKPSRKPRAKKGEA